MCRYIDHTESLVKKSLLEQLYSTFFVVVPFTITALLFFSACFLSTGATQIPG